MEYEETSVDIMAREIEPDEAAEMLDRNYRNNRSINKNRVNAYAADMSAGKWKFTGEAIKFADDGTLLDGQHRLSAIVAAGVPVKMLIIQGVELDAVTNMDTVAPRTLRHVLEFLSYENATGLARTLSSAWVYEHYMEDKILQDKGPILGVSQRDDKGKRPYSRYSNNLFTRSAALELLDRRPTLMDSVAAMKPHSHRRTTQIITPSLGTIALMHNIASTVDEGASVIEYVEHVRSAEGTVEDVTWQVAQILIREDRADSGHKMMPFTKDVLWFRGYERFMVGGSGKLRAPKGNSYPTIPGDVEWYALAGQPSG